MQQNQLLDQESFEEDIKNWEWAWVNKQERYTDQPVGNPVSIARMMYKKYFENIKSACKTQK